jgi:hypothetical protein
VFMNGASWLCVFAETCNSRGPSPNNYNSVAWNLVSDIKGGTQTEGVEENIWTKEG